jgi:hypothetical protein
MSPCAFLSFASSGKLAQATMQELAQAPNARNDSASSKPGTVAHHTARRAGLKTAAARFDKAAASTLSSEGNFDNAVAKSSDVRMR